MNHYDFGNKTWNTQTDESMVTRNEPKQVKIQQVLLGNSSVKSKVVQKSIRKSKTKKSQKISNVNQNLQSVNVDLCCGKKKRSTYKRFHR